MDKTNADFNQNRERDKAAPFPAQAHNGKMSPVITSIFPAALLATSPESSDTALLEQ